MDFRKWILRNISKLQARGHKTKVERNSKIQKGKCKASSFRPDILHGRSGFTFSGRRWRVTIKRLQLPGIQQNGILMVVEVPELAIFHTMEWIQAAKVEFHPEIQEDDRSDSFTISIESRFLEIA